MNGAIIPHDQTIIKLSKIFKWSQDLIDDLIDYKEQDPDERITVDMDLVREIEDKYGTLTNCPKDEPMLIELRKKVGVIK